MANKVIDLTGHKYGKLTVLNYDHNDENKKTYWNCLCDCGNNTIVAARSLQGGTTSSCGCIRRKDVAGQIFDRLTVLKISDKTTKTGTYWVCKCQCGKESIVAISALLSGKTRSCGCWGKGRLGFGEASFNQLCNHYRGDAIKRGYSFDLTQENMRVLFGSICTYCGAEPKQIKRGSGINGDYIYNGIDRLDNTIGYTVENCLPCCIVCNRAKNAMTPSEWQDWIERIVYHNTQEYD